MGICLAFSHNNMGRERAKRPAVSLLRPEEVEDEEEQMEKFFGLLRSIKATRDCWRNEESKKKVKKVKEEKAVWTPSFEWEDFNCEIEFKSSFDTSAAATTSTSSSKSVKKEDVSLGLKLSL